MIYIYGIEPSARALAKVLGCKHGLEISSHTKATTIVNWGRSDFKSSAIVEARTLNKTIILDKLKQLQILIKAGVQTPKVIELGGKILRNREHRGGRYIKFLENNYATEWIEKEREYRVHVFQGRVIRVARKVPIAGAKIWNNDNAHFKYELKVLPRGLKTLAVWAVGAMEYDFGAVDIIMDRDKQLYVLEVNSAPGLDNPQTLEAYAEAIRELEV